MSEIINLNLISKKTMQGIKIQKYSQLFQKMYIKLKRNFLLIQTCTYYLLAM